MYQPSPVTRRASLVAARRFFGAGRFYFRGGYFFLAGGLFSRGALFWGAPLFFSSGFFSIRRGKIFRRSARLYGAQKKLDARHVSPQISADRGSTRQTASRPASQPARIQTQHSRSPVSHPDASVPYPDPPPDATYAKERPTGASGFKRRLVYSGGRRGADRRSYRPAARRGVE